MGTVVAMSAPVSTSYDDTIGALGAIVDRCIADDDRVGYFAGMYLAVTHAVRERAGQGRFDDPARMERFVTTFAGRYLAAHDAWRSGQPCAASWRAAFETCARWRPIILQHLLLGMNAHINLDLGIAASELADEGSLDAVHADFDAINDVLGELVEGCQGALDDVSPWLRLADRIGGSRAESMIRFSLVVARRQAWSVAVRLAGMSGAARQAEIANIDRATAGVAYVVGHPGVPASALLLVVRARERARPGEVIALLAAVRPLGG
jgi:Family of unknown function (DUF5995)